MNDVKRQRCLDVVLWTEVESTTHMQVWGCFALILGYELKAHY